MIPFSELQKIQGEISTKRRNYTGVTVLSHCYPAEGRFETSYTFYMDGSTTEFKTAQRLRAHMENILNPPGDAGIELEG